jgi:hypothetical protein
MAATVNYWPVPATGSGTGNAVLTRAQAVAGSTVTKVLGTDFDNDQWYRTATIGGAGGSVTPSTTDTGGVLTLTTGAGAARGMSLLPHGTIDLLGNPRTTPWYFVTRTIVTTAIDAQALVQSVLISDALANPQIAFGVIGSLSTAFFSYLVTNGAGVTQASAVSTVPIDTAYHVFETWVDSTATTMSLAIDGTVFATTATTNVATTAVTPVLQVYNGTTAAARTMKADYIYLCTPDPAS